MLKIGDLAPDVAFVKMDGTKSSIGAHNGRILVLYFYPKDDTTGCTKEAKEFSLLMNDFSALGSDILGISKDSVKSHAKFSGKYDLTIPLGSDEVGAVCDAFGVWVEKSMYGRQYMGIERATFLVAADGKIARMWRKVKVAGHAAEVLEAVKGMA
jgi:thioredoxin-dependent peroxiredoxin